MRVIRLFALFLCVASTGVDAASGYGGINEPTAVYPGQLFNSVARYLASKVSVSGSSSLDDDRAQSSLGLASDDLGWSQHRLGLNYRDSVSRRENLESSALSLRYGLAVSDFDLGMEFENSESMGVAEGDGSRFDTESERSGFRLNGSRPLYSGHGFALNSVFSHSASTSSAADATGWAEDVDYQVSKFGVEVRESHELRGGFRSSASLRAISGVDTRDATSTGGDSYSREEFRKVALSASLHKEVHRWSLGVGGRYQFAPSDLPSSEELQVAGPSLSTGFNGQARYAAEGGWLRLQAGSPKFQVPSATGFRSSVHFSVLRGWTPGTDAEGEPETSASVGEVSLQVDSRDFLAAMTVGKMLSESDPDMAYARRPDVSLSIFFNL